MSFFADRILLLLSIGADWIPVELNPYTVAEREKAGTGPERAPISESFVISYFQQRSYDLSPEGAKVLDLSKGFFRLGAVLDWAQQHRDSIRADAAEIDHAPKDRIAKTRAGYEADPASLNRELPPIPFEQQSPATFVFIHLLRTMVLQAKSYQFKEHDGLDLCHAVLAAAYGSIATLDKQWKRRVEALPTPHHLAKVFYRPEVDQLVEILEAL